MKLPRILYPFVFCQLSTVTLVAATPAQAISILTNNVTTDINRAYNITSKGSSNFLPFEPYYQSVGDWLSIKLYAFFLQIPRVSMDAIYSGAEANVSVHQHSTLPMDPGLKYTWKLTVAGGELALHFFPKELMTWPMWGLVLHGMKQFMMAFEYVELDFDVLSGLFGPIGHGSIEYTLEEPG